MRHNVHYTKLKEFYLLKFSLVWYWVIQTNWESELCCVFFIYSLKQVLTSSVLSLLPSSNIELGNHLVLYSLHTFKFKSMSRKIYVIWGECKKTKRVLEASMQRKKNMMRWLDFELQCFDKMQASQAASWTREKWPAASYWRQPGHWPSSQSVTTDQRLESPESAPTCQTVLTVLQSCSLQCSPSCPAASWDINNKPANVGNEEDLKKWCVKRNCSAEKQGLFFSRYYYALLILVGTKASQFQAWQFWLWWNISWKWRELSSSRNGLAFPHFTIPYW